MANAKIVIRGNNFLKPPLFETNDAAIIEFYDSFGDMNALFCKIFNDETWGLVTKNDPDWPAMLVKYGYINVNRPVMDVIKNGL